MAGDASPNIEGVAERLVLGTAQLGMDYGIANRAGSPGPKSATAIIEAAIGAGIREFDTAQAYGTSEKILGRLLAAKNSEDPVRIVTKGIVDTESDPLDSLRHAVARSLKNLGIRRLHGFMFHKERFLDQWHGEFGTSAKQLLDEGTVERIGISVYSPEKAMQALAIDEISIIQIPSNIFDRRFENSGVFREAVLRQKRIYVRSVFLQGLLVMPLEDLPPQMAFAVPALNAFQSFADSAGISCHQLALGYARDAYPEAKIIFGAETPEQIRVNITAWHTPLSTGIVRQSQERFKDIDHRVINPTRW